MIVVIYKIDTLCMNITLPALISFTKLNIHSSTCYIHLAAWQLPFKADVPMH